MLAHHQIDRPQRDRHVVLVANSMTRLNVADIGWT